MAHYPEIEIEAVGANENDDSASLIAAYGGNEKSARELAEELVGYALEDWFDPCEAEGIDEEEG